MVEWKRAIDKSNKKEFTMTKEKLKLVAIRLPAELHHRLKVRAVDRLRTLQAVIKEALEEYLAKK